MITIVRKATLNGLYALAEAAERQADDVSKQADEVSQQAEQASIEIIQANARAESAQASAQHAWEQVTRLQGILLRSQLRQEQAGHATYQSAIAAARDLALEAGTYLQDRSPGKSEDDHQRELLQVAGQVEAFLATGEWEPAGLETRTMAVRRALAELKRRGCGPAYDVAKFVTTCTLYNQMLTGVTTVPERAAERDPHPAWV
jgi:hypothetical protein